MSVMRIAVAGSGGLARLIAYALNEGTSHYVIFLSRTAQPQLTAAGFQVTIVDYSDVRTLTFALRGIDTVVSTVTEQSQIELIKAAKSAHVRRFAPAEFEGLPDLRRPESPLDRGRFTARRLLEEYSQHMQSTRFVCGILYERFQPGGIRQTHMGRTSGFGHEGDYMVNCRHMSAQVPLYDFTNDANVVICLTAARDVGRFVARAIDLQEWPPEMRMCGQRISIKDLVDLLQQLRGRPFSPIQWHNPASLQSEIRLARAQGDNARTIRLHTLLATAEGHYDYSDFDLNNMFPDVQPIPFQRWFLSKWNQQP